MLTGTEILIQRDSKLEFSIVLMVPAIPYLNKKGRIVLECKKPLHTITLTPEWIDNALNTVNGAWSIKK